MNACLYCGAVLPAFEAFCKQTCEGLYYATTTQECPVDQESYRHVGYTTDGRPIMGCSTCGESFECDAAAEAAKLEVSC